MKKWGFMDGECSCFIHLFLNKSASSKVSLTTVLRTFYYCPARVLDVDNQRSGTSKGFSCCLRFKAELTEIAFFSVLEPNGQYIDVKASFAPESPCFFTLLFRLIFFAWTAGSILGGAIEDDDIYHFAYLTHVTAILSAVYQLSAILVCAHRHIVAQPSPDNPIPSFWVRLMWSLYSIVAPSEVVVTLLYWNYVYDYDTMSMNYWDVFPHGVIAVLLLIDGFFIGRIPFRLKHMGLFLSYAGLYLIWTTIFEIADIGGVTLYDALDWKDHPQRAGITASLILLGVCPAVFITFWVFSLCTRRDIDVVS